MLSDKIDEEGFWWLPAEMDRKYPGRFEYDPEEGIALALHEVGVDARFGETIRDIPLIYGITAKGRKITLIECLDNGSSWSSAGVRRQLLTPRKAFIGVHLPADGQRFGAAYAELAFATIWLRNSGIKVKEKEAHGEIDIEYREPESIEIEVNGKFELSIRRYLSSVPWGWFDGDNLELREKVTIEIRPASTQSLDFFLDAIFALRDFLTIACDAACSIHAISMESDFMEELYKDKKIYATSDLLMSQPSYRKTQRDPDPRDFLFAYPDVKDRFGVIVNKWFTVYERIRAVKDLYISALYSPFNFIETKFLSLAQAIEVYHRRFWGGEYLARDEFESRVRTPLMNAIPVDLDSAYREVLRQRIGYLNEYSLSKRLKDISREFTVIFTKFYSNPEVVVRGIVEARNHLTHYTRGDREDEFLMHVLKYTDFLKLALDICFLKEIGFSKDEIAALIGRNHMYQNRFRYIE